MNADYQYLVGRIQSALAEDARTSKLDVKVMICGGRIHLTGQTATEERSRAITQVVSEFVPEMEVRNELTVMQVGAPAAAEVIGD